MIISGLLLILTLPFSNSHVAAGLSYRANGGWFAGDNDDADATQVFAEGVRFFQIPVKRMSVRLLLMMMPRTWLWVAFGFQVVHDILVRVHESL